MQKKFLSFAFVAAMLFTGAAFTSCSDDDDDDVFYDTESLITFENVVPMKEFVQYGTFRGTDQPVILPGQSVSFQFYAGKGQRLMFATMYGYSNDMFFAPENPGLQLFNDNGTAITGDVSSQIHLWDNGTRINVQPGPNIDHPGAVEVGNVTKIETEDAQGNLYRAASELMKLNLAYDAATSQFTLTITNASNTAGNGINETPFSPGVWAVSNMIDGKLAKEEPFFKAGEKSSVQLTALAESGNNEPLANVARDMTGPITTLSPVLVVVYTGDINPIYQLGVKENNIGLKELAQKGDASRLKSSLEGMTNVRHVYVLGSNPIKSGEKVEVRFRAWSQDKIAYATMYGYSNDWFYANSESIAANFVGELTGRTTLLDSGTGVNQYPGAGNHQALFGGTPQAEDNAVSVVGTTFPTLPVANVIKVTVQ